MDLLERIDNLVSEDVISESFDRGMPITADTIEEIAADPSLFSSDEARELARELSRGATGRRASELLKEADELLDGHGIEAIRSHDESDRYWGRAVALYVNVGDQYAPTVWYDVYEEEFVITDWSTYMRYLQSQYDNLTQR